MAVCPLGTAWGSSRWWGTLTPSCRSSAKEAWRGHCSSTATHCTSGSRTRTRARCEFARELLLQWTRQLLGWGENHCSQENALHFWNIGKCCEWTRELLMSWWILIKFTLDLIFFSSWTKWTFVAGDTVQQLRVHTPFLEDPSSAPSTHMGSLTTTSKESDGLFWPPWHLHSSACAHT